jgi:hypothetical protein
LRQAYDDWQDQPGNYNNKHSDFPSFVHSTEQSKTEEREEEWSVKVEGLDWLTREKQSKREKTKPAVYSDE